MVVLIENILRNELILPNLAAVLILHMKQVLACVGALNLGIAMISHIRQIGLLLP